MKLALVVLLLVNVFFGFQWATDVANAYLNEMRVQSLACRR